MRFYCGVGRGGWKGRVGGKVKGKRSRGETSPEGVYDRLGQAGPCRPDKACVPAEVRGPCAPHGPHAGRGPSSRVFRTRFRRGRAVPAVPSGPRVPRRSSSSPAPPCRRARLGTIFPHGRVVRDGGVCVEFYTCPPPPRRRLADVSPACAPPDPARPLGPQRRSGLPACRTPPGMCMSVTCRSNGSIQLVSPEE